MNLLVIKLPKKIISAIFDDLNVQKWTKPADLTRLGGVYDFDDAHLHDRFDMQVK